MGGVRALDLGGPSTGEVRLPPPGELGQVRLGQISSVIAGRGAGTQ